MAQTDELDALLRARLAERVQALRGTQSQREVSREARISPTTIRRVEKQLIKRPSLRLALELVEGLELGTIEELLGDIPSKGYLDELRGQLPPAE